MLSHSLLLLLATLSLTVWAQIAMRWSQGRPALDKVPRCPSPWLPVASTAAGVVVALMLTTSLHSRSHAPDETPTVTLQNVQWSVVDGTMHIAIALMLLTGAARVPLRECGLSVDQLDRQLRDGALGFLASVIPVALVLVATSALRTPENQHPYLRLLQEDRNAGMVAAWLLLSAVVVAPIKEELIFRVMLQDGLARRIGSTPAIGVTAILFCLVHGFPDLLALLPLALILGYVYDRRQSVISVVVIHALFNLTNIALLLLDSEAPM